MLMTAACWMLFFATMVAGTVANVVRNVISLDAIRIPPPFSLVDAAIAQKNYPLALTRLLGVAIIRRSRSRCGGWGTSTS